MAPKIVTDKQNIKDIFQPGLIRAADGSPAKQNFYVEHPTEGWRVYLRTACFIHERNKAFNPTQFIVVKRTGGDVEANSWEPPKGQMEGKDISENIYEMLRENIRREVAEEAKIYNLRELQHTGLILQSREPNYPENTFFQYHIFTAYAHTTQIERAFEKFQRFKEFPEAFLRQRREQKEKDDIAWYNPEITKIMGKWSPTIVDLYLKSMA
jgi:8-oxo-dGTP pyrophosphatase MutT (NUDIX family)